MKRKRKKTRTVTLRLRESLTLPELGQLAIRAGNAGVPISEHVSAQLADYARRRSSSS